MALELVHFHCGKIQLSAARFLARTFPVEHHQAFLLSWTTFALLYYVISYLHEDFQTQANQTFPACISNARSFPSVFLFAVETQTTIGYGFRYFISQLRAGSYDLMIIELIKNVFFRSLDTSRTSVRWL